MAGSKWRCQDLARTQAGSLLQCETMSCLLQFTKRFEATPQAAAQPAWGLSPPLLAVDLTPRGPDPSTGTLSPMVPRRRWPSARLFDDPGRSAPARGRNQSNGNPLPPLKWR